MTRRATLGVISDTKSPRRSVQGRFSLLPNRLNSGNSNLMNGMSGLYSTRERERQSFGMHRPSISNMRVNELARRSSVRLSGFGMAATAVKKDPRPIRDKTWHSSAKRTLINFLIQAGYDQAISTKSLQSPSTKDFQKIFIFLYSQIDPYFRFSEKAFQDQVIQLIKGLKYPFADSISKSQLKSVGPMHTWPIILAILIWIVELIVCCDYLNKNQEIDPNQFEKAGTFEMLSSIYLTFDDVIYREKEAEVLQEFDRNTIHFNEENKRLDSEIERLEKELEVLTNKESPLVIAKNVNEQLLQEQNYLNIEIKDVNQVHQQLDDSVKALEADFKVYEGQLSKLTEEKSQLNDEVKLREISSAEIERSQAERNQLLSQHKSIDHQIEEKRKVIGEQEINLRKLIDEVENYAGHYNNELATLGLSKFSSQNVDNNYSYEIPLPLCPANAEGLYKSLNEETMPSLEKLRNNFKESVHSAYDMYISLQGRYSRASEAKNEQSEEKETIQQKIKQASQQYTKTKEEVKVELEAHSIETDKIEKQIQRIQRDGENKLLEWKRKSSKAMMEYDDLLRLYDESKEHIGKEMLDLIQDVMRIKTTVHDNLLKLEKMATDALNEAQ